MSAPGSLPAKKTILGAVCGPVEVPTSGGPEGPGNQFWSSKPGVRQKPIPLTARAGLSRSPLAQAMEAHFDRPRSDRGSATDAVSSADVERELQVLGQNGSVPQQDRVRVFREAFGRAVELLPDYRPLFFSYQQEMDEFGNKLQEQLREFTTAEGRIKTPPRSNRRDLNGIGAAHIFLALGHAVLGAGLARARVVTCSFTSALHP
eukprot:s2809_g7.t1